MLAIGLYSYIAIYVEEGISGAIQLARGSEMEQYQTDCNRQGRAWTYVRTYVGRGTSCSPYTYLCIYGRTDDILLLQEYVVLPSSSGSSSNGRREPKSWLVS